MASDALTDLGTDVAVRASWEMHAILEDGGSRPATIWKMNETRRQFDANLRSVPAYLVSDIHTDCDLEVPMVVTAWTGMLTAGVVPLQLITCGVAWLPHGRIRGLAAGASGLSCVTVHQCRPGMRTWVGA